MRVEHVTKSEWDRVSETAHLAVFGTEKKATRDRFSYALLAIVDEKPAGYIMVRETDEHAVYWQFGGIFQWLRNSTRMPKIFDLAVEKQKSLGAQVIGFRVERENYPMLKLALSRKFLISGLRSFKNKILVEFQKEFGDGD